jgi:hypothetical protein
MERPNFVKKSMPSKGVDTVANQKLNLKICPEKHDIKLVESPKLRRSCHGWVGPHQVMACDWRCGRVWQDG